MAPHGVELNTLKQCLEFLMWLKNDSGKQQEVAQNLHERIKQYFHESKDNFNLDNVRKGLSDFLGHVSAFYTRLCKDPAPGSYTGIGADKVVNALLECLPKFLAAIYFLEYCVNQAFKDLGGGGWQQNWPAWDAGTSSGGDLAKYLYAKTDDQKYNSSTGLIPGGFTYGDVSYYALLRSYYQGYNMVGDLNAIMSKGNYNFLRSVFVTSVFSTDRGTAMQNTANAVSLVRTFCDIVKDERRDNGGTLKIALEAGFRKYGSQNSICWADLKSHCAELREKIRKLFNNPKRFDFTGQSTGTDNLDKEELARETANWMREKLNQVRGKLVNIKTDDPAVSNPKTDNLGAYSTNNIFPYGFTLKGRFHMSHNEVKALMQDWREVIDDLKKADDGLDKLKQILDGTYRVSCPPPPPKKPEVPPAKKSEGAQNQGKKVEGAQNQGKKSEGAQNQGKKAEEAQNQGKKTEGTPNQGEPLGPTTSMSTNQNNGQGEQKFPPPPGVTSTASDTSPGDPGAPGPAGSKGDRDQQGPPVTVTPGSSPPQDTSVKQVVQTQQPGPVQPVRPLPPPTAPPSDSGLPGPAGQPGVGPGSTSVDTQGLPSGVSQGNGPPQIPSVSGQGPGPTGDQRTGPQGGGEAGKGDDLGGGQQSNRDSTQPTNKGTDHNPSNVATPSSAPVPGVGGGGKAAPAKKCVTFNLTNLLKHSNDGDTTEFCDYDYNPPAPKHYKVNDATSEQIWEEYKQREILPPIKEKLEARRREKEEEERRKEDERQRKYQSMLPDIQVVYKARDERLFDIAAKHRSDFDHFMKSDLEVSGEVIRESPDVTVEITKPAAAAKTKDDDMPDPSTPQSSQPPASPVLNGAVVTSDAIKAFRPASPPKPFSAMPITPAGFDGQSITKSTPKRAHPGASKRLRHYLQNYADVETSVIAPVKETHKPTHIMASGEAMPNAKGIPNSTPHGFFAAIGIPEGRPLKPANYVRALPPVSDITGKSIPDRDLNARLLPLSPIGKQPVPIMQPGKREQDVDRYQPAVIRRDLIRPKFPTIVEYIDDHPGLMIDPGICPASYGNSVLPVGRMVPPTDYSSPSPKTVREMLCWLSDLPGTPGLLCQLLNYVYAACHQLLFLRTQCSRDTHSGGWRDCKFGRDVKVSKSWQCSKSPVDPTKLKGHGCDASPLQGFLTDQSDLSTYRYRRGDICRRSRVKLGFLPDNFREESKHGFYIYQILKGLCYNADPLEKLCTYLNCLTRRTPRTTGELVSFFHNIGNELHDAASKRLSPLGSALSKPHDHCPDWDHLAADDLNAIQYIRGPAPPTANHDKGHSRTLSTLVGCDITNAQCPPHISSTTYRAYALYSSSFVHDYLSWTVYLPDRLWESLLKMQDDLENLHRHDNKAKPLHQCPEALPLLYSHGFTPPEGMPQTSLTCSDAVAKLKEVVNGKPIASLVTTMDNFLYGIRLPFLYTIIALWLIATLYILHSFLTACNLLSTAWAGLIFGSAPWLGSVASSSCS
ncbi:Ribosome-binding protein 1 [Babesia ovata]|uniref:Ribosome-binding protein 1 n=1 Tax=Babesia ovata TaxID=189622 RepID=A0A2H6KFU5_9APIC|nr:Ribosome-binding protein 1 [Babesia ovata]GBE61873.1 Ribosome-binding protein 1 [Babesia ovata]